MQANQVVDRLTEEARSRNRAYADIMRQILAERKIALVTELGNVEQNIVRALRVGMGDFEIVQTFQEQILFCACTWPADRRSSPDRTSDR